MSTAAVVLDVETIFDTTWHIGLLHKLSDLRFLVSLTKLRNRDGSVGIATDYGLDDGEVGVRVQVESRIFSSPRRPYTLGGLYSLLSNGHRGLFALG
jgi:hypothetical protein